MMNMLLGARRGMTAQRGFSSSALAVASEAKDGNRVQTLWQYS